MKKHTIIQFSTWVWIFFSCAPDHTPISKRSSSNEANLAETTTSLAIITSTLEPPTVASTLMEPILMESLTETQSETTTIAMAPPPPPTLLKPCLSQAQSTPCSCTADFIPPSCTWLPHCAPGQNPLYPASTIPVCLLDVNFSPVNILVAPTPALVGATTSLATTATNTFWSSAANPPPLNANTTFPGFVCPGGWITQLTGTSTASGISQLSVTCSNGYISPPIGITTGTTSFALDCSQGNGFASFAASTGINGLQQLIATCLSGVSSTAGSPYTTIITTTTGTNTTSKTITITTTTTTTSTLTNTTLTNSTCNPYSIAVGIQATINTTSGAPDSFGFLCSVPYSTLRGSSPVLSWDPSRYAYPPGMLAALDTRFQSPHTEPVIATSTITEVATCTPPAICSAANDVNNSLGTGTVWVQNSLLSPNALSGTKVTYSTNTTTTTTPQTIGLPGGTLFSNNCANGWLTTLTLYSAGGKIVGLDGYCADSNTRKLSAIGSDSKTGTPTTLDCTKSYGFQRINLFVTDGNIIAFSGVCLNGTAATGNPPSLPLTSNQYTSTCPPWSVALGFSAYADINTQVYSAGLICSVPFQNMQPKIYTPPTWNESTSLFPLPMLPLLDWHYHP